MITPNLLNFNIYFKIIFETIYPAKLISTFKFYVDFCLLLIEKTLRVSIELLPLYPLIFIRLLICIFYPPFNQNRILFFNNVDLSTLILINILIRVYSININSMLSFNRFFVFLPNMFYKSISGYII
jgi:hypothetical protein